MTGRAVDQHMDCRKCCEHLVGRGRDVVFDADIAGDRDRALAALRGLAAGRFGRVAVEIDAGDLRARAREGERDGAADAGARAGDDRVLAVQRIGIVVMSRLRARRAAEIGLAHARVLRELGARAARR